MKITNFFDGNKRDLVLYSKVLKLGYFTKTELDKLIDEGDLQVIQLSNKKYILKSEAIEIYKNKKKLITQ
jgi:hypothetical protein